MSEPTPKIADDVDAIYEGIQRVRAEKQRELQMATEAEKAEPQPDAGMFACLPEILTCCEQINKIMNDIEWLDTAKLAGRCVQYFQATAFGSARVQLPPQEVEWSNRAHPEDFYPAEDGLLHGYTMQPHQYVQPRDD